MHSKWYALVVGIVLVLVGLDPWLPTGPEVMVMPVAGAIAIIVGVVGIVVGVMDCRCGRKKKEGLAKEAPAATPPPAGQ